jgi:hypothetical protein
MNQRALSTGYMPTPSDLPRMAARVGVLLDPD